MEIVVAAIAFLSLVAATVQSRAQSRQLALLIREENEAHHTRKIEEEKRLLEYEKKISILNERITNITAQLAELKTEIKDAFHDLHKRINSTKL